MTHQPRLEYVAHDCTMYTSSVCIQNYPCVLDLHSAVSVILK